MKIIGLTGGVASGKNFIADLFSQNGCVVFDADKEAHQLLEGDKLTILEVLNAFPDSFIDGKIDRKSLGKIVFGDAKKLKVLEGIIHPKIRQNYQKFLLEAEKEKKECAILNIPLLLETKGYKCDYIVAIIANKEVREERFLAREKLKHPKEMDAELSKKFQQIVEKQTSDSQRKENADFIINNDGFLDSGLMSQVKDILKAVG
jgi:dephospho-CoA kinase